MKINFTLILSIVFSALLVAFGFTIFQLFNERNRLKDELEKRMVLIDKEISKRKIEHIDEEKKQNLQKLADDITRQYQLLGIALYYNNDSILFFNPLIQPLIRHSVNYIVQAITADSTIGNFIKSEGRDVYQYIRPLKSDDISNSAIVFYIDAKYIEQIIYSNWFRNFIRSFLQVLLVTFIMILVIQWGVFTPINKIVRFIKAARHGNIDQLKQNPPSGFLAPLHKEITNMVQAMNEARTIAEEEAKLRTAGEAIWTSERLKEEIKKLLQNRTLIVVSNREPYMHVHEGREIKYIVPASGMITAMEPILEASGGLWIASGTGDADKEKVDKNNKVNVPPDEPKYVLKRVWLTAEEEEHYYYGFSNEGLWPLCHIAHTRPIFRKEDWTYYQQVNKVFAKAVIEEIKKEEQPFILVQDFHFALLPKLIKDERPDAKVALFWHIPWPNPESFRICPWQQEILLGMLGADLIGFHTQYHCNNFLETVNNLLESRVTWENFSVKIGNHTTFVKPFPISIAFTLKDHEISDQIKTTPSELLKIYGIKARHIGIGVDRIDYTKGLVEKFLSIERFLEKNQSYIGKFTFVQIGAPSRTLIKSYSDTIASMENEANRINAKFKYKDWKAILLLQRHHSHEEILPFYKTADLCMVTSLHDGMNLVAKEFVASRSCEDGVLILSRFAGASQELQGSIIINPYDIDKSADAIKFALEMSKEEQKNRMKQMRQILMDNNIYFWAANLLRTLVLIQN